MHILSSSDSPERKKRKLTSSPSPQSAQNDSSILPARRKPSKVRGTDLPHEYAMEKFLHNVSYRDASWTVHNPIQDWAGISCDVSHQVTWVSWGRHPLGGMLAWESLPSTVHWLNLSGETKREIWLSGSVPFYALPDTLTRLNLFRQEFVGKVEISALPRSLVNMGLNFNQFSGPLDLTCLPPQSNNIFFFRLFVKRGGCFQLRSHSYCALRVENYRRV